MPPRNSDDLDALLYVKNFQGVWEKFFLSNLKLTKEINSLCGAFNQYEERIRTEGTVTMMLDTNGEETTKAVLDNDPQKDWERMILNGIYSKGEDKI